MFSRINALTLILPWRDLHPCGRSPRLASFAAGWTPMPVSATTGPPTAMTRIYRGLTCSIGTLRYRKAVKRDGRASKPVEQARAGRGDLGVYRMADYTQIIPQILPADAGMFASVNSIVIAAARPASSTAAAPSTGPAGPSRCSRSSIWPTCAAPGQCTAVALVECANGMIATIDPSTSRPRGMPGALDLTMEVWGDGGTARIDIFADRVEVVNSEGHARYDRIGPDMNAAMIDAWV